MDPAGAIRGVGSGEGLFTLPGGPASDSCAGIGRVVACELTVIALSPRVGECPARDPLQLLAQLLPP